MLNLVLQSFGRENEYKRAVLTILSFYAHATIPVDQTKVILFTDQPDYFKDYLNELPVSFILLTPQKIKLMRGDIDFLHRMKIELIEEAFTITTGPLFYTDSDCFFTANPAQVAKQVSAATAFMHLPEYPFVQEVEDKTATYKNFYNLINQKDFRLTDGSRLSITPEHYSWNAGVMVFHPSHDRFIPDVYALTDQFYPACGSHASEQYAFSLVLQENTQLQRCDDIVYHYWYRVKKQITDQFLDKKFYSTWSMLPLVNKLTEVKQWTKFLPNLFEKHILMKQDRAIQAFNANKLMLGYIWMIKSFIHNPYKSSHLFKDAFYHSKRILFSKS